MKLSSSENSKKNGIAEQSFSRMTDCKNLPPRVFSLLQGILDICADSLKPLVAQSVEEFRQQLQKLSEHPQANDQQLRCTATLEEVRRQGDALPHRFLRFVENSLVHMSEHNGSLLSTGTASYLTLNLENDVEIRRSPVLMEMGYRFAVLAGTAVLEADALPVGPAGLGEALRFASACLDISANHKAMLLRILDRHISANGERFFQKINGFLIHQGILRHLQSFSSAHHPATEELTPANSGASLPSQENSGEALLAVLFHWLESRRRTLGMNLSSVSPEDYVANAEELQLVLGTLQHKPVVPILLGGKSVPRTIAHIKQDILNQLRPFTTTNHPPRLDEHDLNVIDLAGMFFESLARLLPDNGHLELLLIKLQIPVLRAVLKDQHFFTQLTHPVRFFLGLVIEAGTYWLGYRETTDYSLLEKLQATVDKLSNEFDGNIALFEEAGSDLERYLSLLRRKADIAERRHVEAARGKEKLEIARLHARTAIAKRLKPDTSPLLRTLLECAWSDVLALTLLRHGENNDIYLRRLKITEWLLYQETTRKEHSLPASDVDIWAQEELENGLSQIGFYPEDIQAIIQNLWSLPSAGSSTSAPSPANDLSVLLKDKARLGQDSAEADISPVISSNLSAAPLTELEQKIFDHLKNLPFGTWFEFVLSDQTTTSRRKLAWFSSTTQQCLFLNLHGAQVEDYTLDKLAREVSEGRALIIVEPERTSQVDQAWSMVVEELKGFGQSSSPG